MGKTTERIIAAVCCEVDSAFGYDATLVRRFRKTLRQELRRFHPSKRKLVERAERWRIRAVGKAFRLRITQRALAFTIANAKEENVIAECKRTLRISNT